MNILLVNYNFPPNPGIGGRRWAKFAKFLVRKGHVVHVISAARNFEKESLWEKDTQIPGIENHRITTHYPEYFQRPAKNNWEKIAFRLQTNWIKMTSNGPIYDSARFSKKELLQKSDELIRKHDIQIVIVSAPPFRLFAHATEIKKRNPEIKLIFDYRDPWTNDIYAYGLTELSDKALAWERELEKISAVKADLIISPTKFVTEYLKTYGVKTPQLVIPHAYDPDDQNKIKSEATDDGLIRLVYGGTFYLGLEPLMENFAKALAALKISKPEIYSKFRFDFYTDKRDAASIFSKKGIDIVQFHEPVPVQEFWNVLKNASAFMLVFAKYSQNNKSSKFYELLAQHKPVLVLGDKGETAKFIENNQLGIALDKEQIIDSLPGALERLTKPKEFNETFDVEAFSFDRVTDDLLAELNKMLEPVLHEKKS